MEKTVGEIGLRRHLANRLYPVTLLIWLLISVGFPAIYYILEVTALKWTATIYSQEFSEKFKELVIEDPTLWKYQNHEYDQFLRNQLPQNQVATIRVLDEMGQLIADYEQVTEKADEWWNRYAPIGSAPIIFNNYKIGTVQVKLSQNALLKMTGAFLFLSTTVGTSLAVLVYFFPVKVVGRMERQIQNMIETIQRSNAQSDRLRAAVQASEQQFHNQRDFINDASHELRTPITIIRGHLELLGDEPQERRETVALVLDELDRINRFVNDLLLLAKAEQPNFLNLETVELGLLTEELYAKTTALAVRDWQLEALASGCILADRQRITQAIINLAQNATEHTTDGDVIALGSALTDDDARFWVRDTGEGIALVDQERIFWRFARGSSGRRRCEGAGLGLAIVRAIAEAHGGWVELTSRPGGGSTFTIVIPLEPNGTKINAIDNFDAIGEKGCVAKTGNALVKVLNAEYR